jgi:hypothetical protein
MRDHTQHPGICVPKSPTFSGQEYVPSTSKTGELLHTNAFRSWRDFSHVVDARIRHVERAVDEAAFGATPLRLVILEFVRYAEAGQRIRHGE